MIITLSNINLYDGYTRLRVVSYFSLQSRESQARELQSREARIRDKRGHKPKKKKKEC